jgi:hypothetical protein
MKHAIEDRGDHTELVSIEGEQLSAVTFVQDYVQLHFDGPRLTLLTWPAVITADASYAFGEPGYRDWLCKLIGRIVARAYVRVGERLQVDFVDTASLVASLRPEAYCAAHVVIFDDEHSKHWAAW